MRPYLI